MNRSQMMKLMYKINKNYFFYYKYIILLPLFSLLYNIFYFKDNKFFTTILTLIKLIIIINIVLGVSIVL